MNAKNINVKMTNNGLKETDLTPKMLEDTAPGVLQEQTMRETSHHWLRTATVKIDLDKFDSIIQHLLNEYNELPLAEQLAARDGFLMGVASLGIAEVQSNCYEALKRYHLTQMQYLLRKEDQRDRNQYAAFVMGFTDVMRFWHFNFPRMMGVQQVLNSLDVDLSVKTLAPRVVEATQFYLLRAVSTIRTVVQMIRIGGGCTESLKQLVFDPKFTDLDHRALVSAGLMVRYGALRLDDSRRYVLSL